MRELESVRFVVFVVLRREGCPSPVAALLAATLLVTGTGLGAATWIRHETLPVVLQLLAVAWVTSREFDAVVLFDRPEARRTSTDVRLWYDRHHFGREIVDAVERNYRAAFMSGGTWISERRSRS